MVKNYPVEISVSIKQRAQFDVSGGVGYVPATLAGLKDCKGFGLYRICDGKMTEEDQSVNGNDFWQTDYDPVSETWSITYNVSLDAPVTGAKPITFLFEQREDNYKLR